MYRPMRGIRKSESNLEDIRGLGGMDQERLP